MPSPSTSALTSTRAPRLPHRVDYRHGTLLDALAAAPAGRWTRFCLSDVVDWMGPRERERLFAEVLAHGAARVRESICRTVEDSILVDELGLEGPFPPPGAGFDPRLRAERSCLYRRVNCFEVTK